MQLAPSFQNSGSAPVHGYNIIYYIYIKLDDGPENAEKQL